MKPCLFLFQLLIVSILQDYKLQLFFFPSLHPIKADRDFIPAPFQDGLASTVGDAVLKSNKTHQSSMPILSSFFLVFTSWQTTYFLMTQRELHINYSNTGLHLECSVIGLVSLFAHQCPTIHFVRNFSDKERKIASMQFDPRV